MRKLLDYAWLSAGFFDAERLEKISRDEQLEPSEKNIRNVYRKCKNECIKQAYSGNRGSLVVLRQFTDYDMDSEVKTAIVRLENRGFNCQPSFGRVGVNITITW